MWTSVIRCEWREWWEWCKWGKWCKWWPWVMIVSDATGVSDASDEWSDVSNVSDVRCCEWCEWREWCEWEKMWVMWVMCGAVSYVNDVSDVSEVSEVSNDNQKCSQPLQNQEKQQVWERKNELSKVPLSMVCWHPHRDQAKVELTRSFRTKQLQITHFGHSRKNQKKVWNSHENPNKKWTYSLSINVIFWVKAKQKFQHFRPIFGGTFMNQIVMRL